MSTKLKTLIAVLASHDSRTKNKALRDVLEDAFMNTRMKRLLSRFRFVLTGGTYGRLFHGDPVDGQSKAEIEHELSRKTKTFLQKQCGIIRLPVTDKGGVTILASLITQRKVSILWPFFSSLTTHLLNPENLALLRLADQWRVKKLMNSGSVNEWLLCEADRDVHLNMQPESFEVGFPSGVRLIPSPDEDHKKEYHTLQRSGVNPPWNLDCKTKKLPDKALENAVIALISHDEMKHRMIDFVIDYEHELVKFKSILTTGTTGKLVSEAVPALSEKVKRYHSGPKGGDIEIAAEILYGGCSAVIFFVDPLHPHPHVEDIRVVFGACMIQNEVRMLSNEMQARAWMDRRIRGT